MGGQTDSYSSYIISQVKSLKKKLPNDKRSGNPFVTISRQTGAYGTTVSNDLGEYLQKNERRTDCVWTVFDKELIDKVVEEHDLPKTVLPYLSEDKVSEIQDMIEESLGLHPSHDVLVQKTNKTILHLAQLGYAIIVGRASNIITAQIPGGVNIRLISPLEKRVEHIQEYYQMTQHKAKELIFKEEHMRKDYVKKYFNKDIEDPLLYDMVINVDSLGPQRTIKPMNTNTLRFRISVLYVAVIGLVLFFFQGILYFNYVNSVSKAFDDQLQMKAEQIGGAVNTFRDMFGEQKQAFPLAAQKALNLGIQYPEYTFMTESPEKFWLADAKKLGLDRDYLVIMDNHGGVITKSRNVPGNLLYYFKKIGRSGLNKNMFFKVNVGKNDLRVVAMPYYYTYKQGYIILVGSSYYLIEKSLGRRLLSVFGSTLIFLIIASLIVRIFVIRVLSSVMEISNAARNISQENLNARIKLTHADEEIKHLVGSLNEMIGRLEGSFAHVKEFSLEMAHEVKTPLAIISGESQMALGKDCTGQQYKEIFNIILKEARRSQKFVSDLLLLTKLDYRLIKLRFVSIDLGKFLREICEKMRFVSALKEGLIRQDLSHEPILVKGDKIHLTRVFFNLIDNALKFTPPGGHIDVVLRRNNQKAIVLVSDTGCGIARDEFGKIFDKFYRVSRNDQEDDHGTGMGLSIVHSIIMLHGGGITVNSDLGKGTTFNIELPLV
jgi:signal transduction histidine kinase/cytidylate kinase